MSAERIGTIFEYVEAHGATRLPREEIPSRLLDLPKYDPCPGGCIGIDIKTGKKLYSMHLLEPGLVEE